MKTTFWQEIYFFYKKHSILTRIIIINIAVFIIVGLIGLIFFFDSHSLIQGYKNPLVYWLSVHSNIALIVQKPWSIITYMFLHIDFFHIFFNMIVLYFGGNIFLSFFKNNQLVATYILGGFLGAIFYIIAFNIFPVFQPIEKVSFALGASASVLAILVAAATYSPNTSVNLLFIGQLKLKYIALILVGIDIFSIDKGNPGGHIAHLGGAFWGFIYADRLKKGTDITAFFCSIGNGLKSFFYTKNKTKMKIDYKAEKKHKTSDEEYNRQKQAKQEQIDAILDKISKRGYESLSKEEKEFLFKISNKN